METSIIIKGLKLHGYHGVTHQEQEVGNTFSFDVEIVYPFMGAALSDNLMLTVNYAEVVDLIKSINDEASNLLEHVVMRIREALLARYPAIKGGRVRVAKLTPPIPSCEMDYTAVEISW